MCVVLCEALCRPVWGLADLFRKVRRRQKEAERKTNLQTEKEFGRKVLFGAVNHET